MHATWMCRLGCFQCHLFLFKLTVFHNGVVKCSIKCRYKSETCGFHNNLIFFISNELKTNGLYNTSENILIIIIIIILLIQVNRAKLRMYCISKAFSVSLGTADVLAERARIAIKLWILMSVKTNLKILSKKPLRCEHTICGQNFHFYVLDKIANLYRTTHL